ncbi:MAG: hypothetical protein LBU34_02490 [Planctomycetaceae bacterium]|nr:hypothetical protein [Planctomycetaceae bacterium]
MRRTLLLLAGLIGAAMFGFYAAQQLQGNDRYAPPTITVAEYTLDGTLEPDDIPVFTHGFPVAGVALRNNMLANGTAYAPDAAVLAVDAPVRLPELPAGGASPLTDTAPLTAALHTTAVNPDDIPLILPPRFRTDTDLFNINEKYALVQYQSRTKNRSPKHDHTPEEPKPVAAESPSGLSVREMASMTDEERAALLKKSIRTTLAANTKRALTTQNNTPGDVLLMALPYGADAKVYQPALLADPRDKTAPKGSYIYSIGTLCWNYPCSGKTLLRSDGKRVYARVGAGFQRRPASFLALLAMSNIMPNYELKVNSGNYSIGHLIASEKAAVSKGSNMSMALVGLSFYGEAGEHWKNEMGETWTIERMVTEELNRSIDQGSSDVTDWLLGLTAAVKLYEEESKAIRGPMALAKRQLGTYHDFVLSVQNDQYLWHPKFFLFKGTTPDVYETLYSSGHILRWLLLSLSDKELKDPRVTRAVTSLLSHINRIPANVVAGTMTDRQLEALALSLHALSIYNQRVFGDDQPEEPEKNHAAINNTKLMVSGL